MKMTQELWLEVSERENPIGVNSFLSGMLISNLEKDYMLRNNSYPVDGDD